MSNETEMLGKGNSGEGALYDSLFRAALRIRLVEERVIDLYPSDKIQSPVHLSIGQEAVAVGVCDCLEREDWIFPTYRSHAVYLAKGGDMETMFAELYGKITGEAKGKAGSMHLTSPSVGMMGSSAIVASSIPHAVGAAYASKLKGEPRVHVAFFGDGATEAGVYHEALNFAALHRLPVIFVCENNGLAAHSRRASRQNYDICAHAEGYGISAIHLKEGHDFLKIRNAFAPLVTAAREGKGPRFIEIDTYRYKEHVGIGEDYAAGYRSREELEAWQAMDPLIGDRETAEKFRPDIEKEIDAAVQFAENSEWPSRAELETDVDAHDRDDARSCQSAFPEDIRGRDVISYCEALAATMWSGLAANETALVLGQGVDDHKGIFGTTVHLRKGFGPERCVDTPISEEGTTGIALGISLKGMYPIQTHIRADFMLPASNQIINLVAKYQYMFGGLMKTPMLFRAVVGRSWGQGAQHSQSLQSLFAHIPGLTVIMPATPQAILETYPYVIEHYQGPVISLEHRLLYDLEFAVDWEKTEQPRMPLSSRKVRSGNDVTVVATSIMVLESLRAAKHLSENAGIECDIIDLHCVSHPDHAMILESVSRTGKLLVADTSWVPYGAAAEVCRIICERSPQSLKAPAVTVGMAHAPCPTAKTLEDMYYPNLGTLVDAAAGLATGRKDHGVPLPDENSMADVYKRFKGPF